jgi:hypothetical protein
MALFRDIPEWAIGKITVRVEVRLTLKERFKILLAGICIFETETAYTDPPGRTETRSRFLA